jgi:hypothetical protein
MLSFRTASRVSRRGTAFVLIAATLIEGALSGCVQAPSWPLVVSQPIVPFPGPGNFQGGFVPAAGHVNDGVQSDYAGTLVVTMLDRNLVNSVLPPGASLAPTTTPSTMHPVIYLIGFQGKPSTVSSGHAVQIPFATGYREMSLLIPFVVLNNGANWHNYVVRMYLDDPTDIAILGGNTCCGYQKVAASLDYRTTNTGYNHSVQTLFASDFVDTIALNGSYVTAGQAGGAVPRLADLQTILQMPILGSNLDPSGNLEFLCTYWDWNFSHAKVAPVTSAFEFVSPFASGMQGWTALGTLTNAANGAVAMRHLRWRLSLQTQPC